MKGSPSPRMSTFILWMIHFHPLDRLLSPFEPSTFILWTVHFPHKPLNNGNRPLYEGPPTFGGPWFNKVFRIVFFGHVKTENIFVRLRDTFKVMIFLNFWFRKMKIWLVRSAFFYKNNLFLLRKRFKFKITDFGNKMDVLLSNSRFWKSHQIEAKTTFNTESRQICNFLAHFWVFH